MPDNIASPALRRVLALIGRAILGAALILAAFPLFAFAIDYGSDHLGQPVFVGASMLLAVGAAYLLMLGPYLLSTGLTSLFPKRSSTQSSTVEKTA